MCLYYCVIMIWSIQALSRLMLSYSSRRAPFHLDDVVRVMIRFVARQDLPWPPDIMHSQFAIEICFFRSLRVSVHIS